MSSVPKQAVTYVRVSSADQEREGFSIPAQQKLLKGYASEEGWNVVREFQDVETAKQTGRPAFGEMVAFLRNNRSCRTILVEKTDRLYRNIRDWVTIEELGVEVRLVKENSVISRESRSSEKFLHGIKVLMAKNYIDNLSEEVKKGMLQKAEQGDWPSVAPVGYVNNRSTHRIEIDPERAPLVVKLFELYATGKFSLHAVTAKAREMGLTSARARRPMLKAQIHRLLQNPLYVGDFRWNDRVRRGNHNALISRELFATVQEILARKPRARLPKQKHAFMGLLTCGRCGCSITAERKKERYVYYRCTGFHGACGNTYIREERLAELLGGALEEIQMPTDVADWLAAGIAERQSVLESSRTECGSRIAQQVFALEAKLDRAYEDYLEGRISDDFWSRKSSEWHAQATTLRIELEKLTEPAPRFDVTADRILELAKTAHLLYREQSASQQRKLLDTVLSNCTFDRGTLSPTWIKPFDLIVEGNRTGDWRGGRDSNPRPPA
jgi:site-specific DNA recombinase